MTTDGGKQVRSSARTFRIVEGIKELEGATITELSGHVDLPKSTVLNHLKTLEQEEYVIRRGDTYRLGLRFLELGEHTKNRLDLYYVAKPSVDKLAAETGELANLAVEEYGQGVYLHSAQGDQAVDLNHQVGKRKHLHDTAWGKAMLAFMPEEEVESVIDRHGLPARASNTITDPDVLAQELEAVRDRGYAFDDEESLEGLRCIGAPVQSKTDDRVIGAVSLSGPVSRFTGDRFRETLPQKVLDATNVIEIDLSSS